MAQHSILDLGLASSVVPAVSSLPPSAAAVDGLLFPGDDGGQSLAAWARRDLEATLQLLADRAQYITGGSGAAIALRDGENIICRASSGPSAPEVGSYFQASSGLSGESVRTRKTICCNDTATDPRVNQEGCRALGIASFAVLPLVRDDEVIGIFEVFASNANAFGERDILALQRMGEMVNTALDQVSYSRPKSAPSPAFSGSGPETIAPREHRMQSAHARSNGNGNGSAASDLFESVDDNPSGSNHEHALADEPIEPLMRPVRTALTVHTCSTCGFPISEGRTLCLDCEAAAGKNAAVPALPPHAATPGFLADLPDREPPAGVAHWISVNRYLLGMIAVTLSTIVFLLTR
jgi:hypothetical protein